MAKDNKPVKKAEKKKKNIFVRFASYCKDVASELKRVTWPTSSEMVKSTRDVFAFVIAMAILVWLLDISFNFLINLLLG